MKKVIAACVLLAVGTVFALDDEAWLSKARECAAGGFLMDADETNEDGVYCLVLAAINTSSDKSADVLVSEAVLTAKSKITAYVKGETVSALKSVEIRREEISTDGEKIKQSYQKYESKIKTKVDALVKGIKPVGQVTAGDKSYVVCVTCERFEDQTKALEAAQAQYGDEGVVVAVGEAKSLDLAKQKAIRGAVEQVLGTVVVGYDKMSTKSDFQSKVFSGTDGVVEKYRVLSESEVGIGKRIEIVAKVSKKNLLDNYSNYMKFLGDPGFYIESNSPDLSSHFTEFFTDMGIRVVDSPDAAKYLISCAGNFREVEHALQRGRHGHQLSLRFRIRGINDPEVLIDMKNDARKAACFVGSDPDRQKELCAEKAFKQMKDPLHEKIQMMIGKLVGREMSKAAAEDDED